jgi:signal transduction histidine kinase
MSATLFSGSTMRRVSQRLSQLSLAQQFMLANFLVLVISMLLIGWWVGQQIETGVIDRTAGQTALYVDSFVDPALQGLAPNEPLTSDRAAQLDRLVADTPLSEHIVAFKIWNPQGRILYSTNPALIGQVFPLKDELARAIQGEVVSHITDLEDVENLLERGQYTELIETYSPVQANSTNEVIAVVEFYQPADALRRQIQAARTSSWIVVGAATLLVYAALTSLVRRGSHTIERQRAELRAQVTQLTDLLEQNQHLHQRVSRATAHAAELNERFLRRISAELHDGPAQDLGLALLRLDKVIARSEALTDSNGNDLAAVETAVRTALQEVRAISGGLGVPELDRLTLTETLARVIKVQQRRTEMAVATQFEALPDQAPLPIKIAAYRLIQEALSNAHQHAAGREVQVCVTTDGDQLRVEVSDRGPGFAPVATDPIDHLGLAGMRERVESLGGRFEVHTSAGQGTRIIGWLPLVIKEEARS